MAGVTAAAFFSQSSFPGRADAKATSPGLLGAAMAAAPVGFRETKVLVGGQSVPLSVWYPTDASSAGARGRYSYPLSIGTIASRLAKLPTATWLAAKINVEGGLRSVVANAAPKNAEDLPALFFAHGFLGSRFDMLHVAEALASQGFVVASADLPESLSASFVPNERTTRGAIVEAAFQALHADFGASQTLRGLFGHSAGGGTACITPGTFPLGRVAIAGFRGYEGPDPLLVVASSGDGIIPLPLVRQNLPQGTRVYVGASGAQQLASDCASQGAVSSRSALLFEPNAASGASGAVRSGGAIGLPCHISFLSTQTNDALLSYLSPLLPLARALKTPLLDFDVYSLTRDSAATAAVFVPAVSAFFRSNANQLSGASGFAGKLEA